MTYRKPTRPGTTRLKKSSSSQRFAPCSLTTAWSATGPDKHKGGLRLDLRDAMLKGGETGPAIVPGKPEASPLIEAVRYAGEVQMPPKKKLKDDEIAVLSEWIKRVPTGLRLVRPSVPALSPSLPRPQPSQHTHPACRPRTRHSGHSSRSRARYHRRSRTPRGPVADRPVHPGETR